MSKIKVLVKKPDCEPEVLEIENDYKEFKRLIGGGTLECFTLGSGIMMYLDDEGKLKGLPYNFELGGVDFAVGNVVFFANDGGEEEQSLSDLQIDFLLNSLKVGCVPLIRSRRRSALILIN